MSQFYPCCLPLLIGSLPHTDHREATELVFSQTPDVPIWPQLPVFKEEGMIRQYIPGLPSVSECDGKLFIDTASAKFEEELLAFYEEYLMVSEGMAPIEESRFVLTKGDAGSFYELLDLADKNGGKLTGLKGQTTGPITFCTGLVDQAGRAIYYNEQLRDAAVKHLAMKAKWQTRKMAEKSPVVIMFFDEPGLAGLGSSAFITISNDDIAACFTEVFDAVKSENGLTGIHVCANTEWPVVFNSGVDIVSYDAYSYFDKIVLYNKELVNFMNKGGILATGIVPTIPEYIGRETVDSLTAKWLEQCKALEGLGLSAKQIYKQTFITPSCGMGTISTEQANTVMELTKGVSAALRKMFG